MSAISSSVEKNQIVSQAIDGYRNPMTYEERLSFRITQFSMDISVDSLYVAIKRVNGCWDKIKGYSGSKEHLTTDFAITALVKGICRGSVESLLDRCAKGLSIEEAAQQTSSDKEVVYFRHLFPSINLLDLMEKNYAQKQLKLKEKIDDERRLIPQLDEAIIKKRSETQLENEDDEIMNKMQLLDLLIDHKEITEKLEIDERKKDALALKLTGTQMVIKELTEAGILRYNSNSIERKAQCKCFDSLSDYNKTLDNLFSNVPQNVTARGIIELPKHTMGFEHGPEGFYIFDTFTEAGLYRFPDRDTFIKALQSFVCTSMHPESSNPDYILTEDLKKAEVLFSITSLISS